jgi:colanic acid/amylovoran biosynthesis glycosyltransferase
MSDLSSNRPSVVHFTDQYFLLTQNWIQTQIGFHDRYAPFVLTGRTENLDQASGEVAPYFSLNDRSAYDRWADWLTFKLHGYLHSFYRRAQAQDPDLAHAHFGPKGYGGLSLIRRLGISLITTFYGYDASSLLEQEPEWRDRYQTLFEEGDHFLAEGPHMRNRLIDLGCPPEKVSVHHLSVDLDEFAFHQRQRDPSEPLRLLMVGRFTEKKGMLYGLKAFAAFRNHGGQGELTIVGDAKTDHEAQQAYKQQMITVIETEGLQDSVDFRGLLSRDELRATYNRHHVLLAPSVHAGDGDDEGGAPVVLIEAAATGMPAVATYHCDIPEIVTDGETGLLASERDIDALTQALIRLWEQPSLLAAMGESARQRIEDEFEANRQARRLEALYDRVRDPSAPAPPAHTQRIGAS